MALPPELCRPAQDWWRRKTERVKKTNEVLEKLVGLDFCEAVDKVIEGQAKVVKELVKEGNWAKVRTEMERLIDYVDYKEMCGEKSTTPHLKEGGL